MTAEERIQQLGYTLPENIRPQGAYNPGVICGNVLYTAGQTPRKDGVMQYSGKVGTDLTLEEAQEAARICALNCLGIIRAVAGSLERVKQIVKVTGFVASGEGFTGQTQAVDGASQFLKEIFGEKAVAARSAVGVFALPGNAPIEVEMIVEL
ncbi:MAG: RidA family protein, partial [Lachnospiraceae bacterium]|nr:RidA family protein [Lachnospiraceae bacterium]